MAILGKDVACFVPWRLGWFSGVAGVFIPA